MERSQKSQRVKSDCPREIEDFSWERQRENNELRYEEPDIDDSDFVEDEGE